MFGNICDIWWSYNALHITTFTDSPAKKFNYFPLLFTNWYLRDRFFYRQGKILDLKTEVKKILQLETQHTKTYALI